MLKNRTSLMVLTLICLGLLISIGVRLAQPSDVPRGAAQDDLSETGAILNETKPLNPERPSVRRPEQYANVPASILSASQQINTFILKGTGVPGAGLVLQTGMQEVVRTKVDSEGQWSLSFLAQTNDQKNPLYKEESNIRSLDLVMSTPDGHQIRSDQSLIIVNKALGVEAQEKKSSSETSINIEPETVQVERALILLTAPGANSYVFQSPFGTLPQRDGFALEAIDYDNSGGVIFSGTSKYAGEVYIYARGSSVGKSHVDNTGRWSLIFGSIMPLGEYDITAELIRKDGVKVRLTLPFSRKAVTINENGDGPPALTVEHLSDRLQIGRALFGGGYQYTVVYGPLALEE